MTRTVIGKLDYENDVARIEGDAVPTRKMLAKVAAFLRAKPMKGQQVVAQIIEEGEHAGWIERIEPLPLDDKLKKNGFGQPTPGPGEAAANAAKDRAEGAANMEENRKYAQELAAGRGKAPETPAPAPAKPAGDGLPKAVEGKIISYSPAPARSFTLQSEEGFNVVIAWRENQDTAMATFKPGYKAKATYEIGQPNRLIEIVSTYRKGSGGGKGNYQPRNERLIAFLAIHRDTVALFQSTTTPDTVTFEDAEDAVYKQAKKTLEQAMRDFGGS